MSRMGQRASYNTGALPGMTPLREPHPHVPGGSTAGGQYRSSCFRSPPSPAAGTAPVKVAAGASWASGAGRQLGRLELLNKV